MTRTVLYCNATRKIFYLEMSMNTATITQAQSKGLRHQFAEAAAKLRAFAIEMYTAHGGWFVVDAAQPASGALAAEANRINN